MISINKKYILFFAMATTSWFAQSTTLTIPQATVKDQEVSLFVLVEDQDMYKAGFFELDSTEKINKIHTDEFYDVKEAAFDLDGTDVAFSDSSDLYLEDNSIIYFEIDSNVKVIKALVISNSLLDEVVIQFADLDVADDDESDDFSFDFADDMFGENLEDQVEAVSHNQPAPAQHFSVSQVFAIVQIAALVGMDKTKRACSSVNKNARRFARWLTGYES